MLKLSHIKCNPTLAQVFMTQGNEGKACVEALDNTI